MKNLLLVACVVLILPAFGQKPENKPLNVMSYNIRYNTGNDGVNAWPNRKDWVKDLVEYYGTDILCVQEALQGQVEDLLKDSRFELEGVGRDDGKTKGEYTAIFYNKNRFKKQQSGTSGFRIRLRNLPRDGMPKLSGSVPGSNFLIRIQRRSCWCSILIMIIWA
jgi:endonuclease/exonuclease/phosphatase family metal-dependent hydrolase